MIIQTNSISAERLLAGVFVVLAVLMGSALLFAAPADAAPYCAYNSTQATCACPTTGPGITCINQLYKSVVPTGCYDDPRVGQSPAPDCASNQRLDCASGLCVCDTPNYPCSLCRVALSTVGQACTGDVNCPTNGGQYSNVCSNSANAYAQNAYKCPVPNPGNPSDPANTTWCDPIPANAGKPFYNACVNNRVCPAGTTWDVCTDSCVTPNVILSPGEDIGAPFVQSGYIKITGDIETTGGDVVSANNVTANGFCFDTDCVTGWADLSWWTLAGSDIYNNNTGNVGIGTSAPQSLLHLGGNALGFGITLTNTANAVGSQGMRIAFDNNRLTFQRASDAGAWEADLVSIDQNSGAMGIGTTSPEGLFEVQDYVEFGAGSSTSVGYQAGNPASASNYLTAIGYQAALGATTLDHYNTVVGYRAGYGMNGTDGDYNTLVGAQAGYTTTSGDRNTAVGYAALYQGGAGVDNTAVGYGAGTSATSGSNTIIGSGAGSYADATNVDIGYYAGAGSSGWLNNDSSVNVGFRAGQWADAGYNVLVGYFAGYGDLTQGGGQYNSGVGTNALRNVLGNFNVGMGGYAGYGAASPTFATGSGNVSMGYQSNSYLSTGNYNIAIGYLAGAASGGQVNSGNYNMFLGYYTGFGSATQWARASAIGHRAIVDCDDCISLGNVGWPVKVGIAESVPGFPLDVNGSNAGTAVIRARSAVPSYWTGLRLDSTRAPATTQDEKWFIGMNQADATLRFRAGGATDVMTLTQNGNVTSTGCFGPTYVGTTAGGTPYNGSLNGTNAGYAGANALCASAIFGSHVCTPDEIIRTVSCNAAALPVSGTVWINNGPPGFTSPAANDCNGWASSSSSSYGAFWLFSGTGGSGAATACNVTKAFACCK